MTRQKRIWLVLVAAFALAGGGAAVAIKAHHDRFESRLTRALGCDGEGSTAQHHGFYGEDYKVLDRRATSRFATFCGGVGGPEITWLRYADAMAMTLALDAAPESYSDYVVVCVNLRRAELLVWTPEITTAMRKVCLRRGGRVLNRRSARRGGSP